MSHRDEPRSGRGCFAAVVVVPFLALGGMFVLIALTGSPEDSPLASPNTPRPSSTSQWWTEPFASDSTATVTETVVLEGQQREIRAARLATQTRVSTVTETVRSTVSSSSRPAPTGRNEPPASEVETPSPQPTSSSSAGTAPPVVTTGIEHPTAPPFTPAPSETPVETPAEPPATEAPSTTTPCPRSEDPVPAPAPSPSPAPPVERGEPAPSVPEEPAVSVEATVELPLPTDTPAAEVTASSAPVAGA